MNKQYGLIGFPLSHSFSPSFFMGKFVAEGIEATYTAFPLANIALLPGLLNREKNLCGLNVTIPYKTSVIPYLDHISAAAREIGAVNCIRIADGKLYGYNTDYIGFKNSLEPLLGERLHKALILGTGGAAKAVLYALAQLKISCTTVSSSGKGDLCYEELDAAIIEAHPLIVQTSPLGMSPNPDQCPDIPYHLLGKDHMLYDLVYNPEETLFLKKGKQQKARIKNGYEMLVLQAEKSWEIWNGNVEF